MTLDAFSEGTGAGEEQVSLLNRLMEEKEKNRPVTLHWFDPHTREKKVSAGYIRMFSGQKTPFPIIWLDSLSYGIYIRDVVKIEFDEGEILDEFDKRNKVVERPLSQEERQDVMSELPRHIREKISKITITEAAFQKAVKIVEDAGRVFSQGVSGYAVDNRSGDVVLCVARMLDAYEQDPGVKEAIGEFNISNPLWLFAEAMVQAGRG